MQRIRHPHLHAVVRLAAVSTIAAVSFAACGSNGDDDVALTPAAAAGRDVVRTNGCAACHGRNGQGGPGPSFIGLVGSTVEFKDGSTTVADDDYLYEAISDPGARVREGWGFPMPSNDLDDAQIESVIAFIRELADAGEQE